MDWSKRINVGIVKKGDVITYIRDIYGSYTAIAPKDGVYEVPPDTKKAWVNGKLRIDL